MPRRHCKMCRSPLHVDDAHAECVSCLGKSHADSALSGTDCSHCENFSLASLCARIAFFSENDCSPRPPDRLGSGDSEILPNNLAERGRVRVSLPLDPPQAASIVSLAAHYRKYFSAYHKRPALMQPVCTAVSSPCHSRFIPLPHGPRPGRPSPACQRE